MDIDNVLPLLFTQKDLSGSKSDGKKNKKYMASIKNLQTTSASALLLFFCGRRRRRRASRSTNNSPGQSSPTTRYLLHYNTLHTNIQPLFCSSLHRNANQPQYTLKIDNELFFSCNGCLLWEFDLPLCTPRVDGIEGEECGP